MNVTIAELRRIINKFDRERLVLVFGVGVPDELSPEARQLLDFHGCRVVESSAVERNQVFVIDPTAADRLVIEGDGLIGGTS